MVHGTSIFSGFPPSSFGGPYLVIETSKVSFPDCLFSHISFLAWITNSTSAPQTESWRIPGPYARDLLARVFKKKWNGTDVVVKSPLAQVTYITASFGPKSSKFGEIHSISVSEMYSAVTSLVILEEILSTARFPTVKVTLMFGSLKP